MGGSPGPLPATANSSLLPPASHPQRNGARNWLESHYLVSYKVGWLTSPALAALRGPGRGGGGRDRSARCRSPYSMVSHMGGCCGWSLAQPRRLGVKLRPKARAGRMQLTDGAVRGSLRRVFQRLIDLADRHFWNHRHRSKGEFLWRITLERTLIGIAVAILLSALGDPPRTDLNKRSDFELVLKSCLLAPVFETLIFQAFPVMIVRLVGGGFRMCIVAGLVPFALAHFPSGFGTGVAAGIVGGFYLAFTYVNWRSESLRAALGMTIAVHALSNASLILPIVLLR